MKNKLKVYLDTSVISALFDTRNPERQLITQEFFDNKDFFEIYISDLTILEIEETQDEELKSSMEAFISIFEKLLITDEVERLANEYVRYGAISNIYIEDALHIAIAVLNNIDYLLSWNFKHIVRLKTRDTVKMINTLNRLTHTEIFTPGEIL